MCDVLVRTFLAESLVESEFLSFLSIRFEELGRRAERHLYSSLSQTTSVLASLSSRLSCPLRLSYRSPLYLLHRSNLRLWEFETKGEMWFVRCEARRE